MGGHPDVVEVLGTRYSETVVEDALAPSDHLVILLAVKRSSGIVLESQKCWNQGCPGSGPS